MRKDLDERLVADYPKIFRNRHASMRETAMCWGFAHGDGWHNLLRQACSVMQGHIDASRKARASALRYNRALKRAVSGDTSALERFYSAGGKVNDWVRKATREDVTKNVLRDVPPACPQVVAIQVKEKFGALRFYYDGGDAFIDGVISMLEACSCVTCEECARPGVLEGPGWLRTLCVSCRMQNNQERSA